MNRKVFFDLYRKHLDKNRRLTQREVNAIDVFLDEFEKNKIYFTVPQWAYVFATTFHETAFTFEPVIEAFHLSEGWRRRNLRYYPYFGRGYVQLTWESNYKKYSNILGIDFIKNPKKLLNPEISFFVLTHGMKNGTFTGVGIGRYINNNRKDYVNARRVINGTDKSFTIAKYAEMFEYILEQSLK